jgi:Amt family ammonium transporter
VLTFFGVAFAEKKAPTVMSNKEAIDLVQTHANYVWTLVAAVLVFFMQAGFALVETSFTRAKNAVNILMKNLMDFSMGSIAYWALGFGLMFGVSKLGWFGTSGFFLSDFKVGGAWGTLAAGLFNIEGVTAGIIVVQVLGIVSCFIWTFVTAFILFKIIDVTMGLRVSPEEEAEGLDGRIWKK